MTKMVLGRVMRERGRDCNDGIHIYMGRIYSDLRCTIYVRHCVGHDVFCSGTWVLDFTLIVLKTKLTESGYLLVEKSRLYLSGPYYSGSLACFFFFFFFRFASSSSR